MKQTTGLQAVREYTLAYQTLRKIISEEKTSDAKLCAAAKINTSILSKIKYDKKNRIDLRIYISVCVGAELSTTRALEFIEAAGYKLQRSIWIDSCYLEILDHYADRGDIDVCNEKLKELGMPSSGYLGSQDRNFKNRK